MPLAEQGEPAAKPVEQFSDFVNEARSAIAVEHGQSSSPPVQSPQAGVPIAAPSAPASPVDPAVAWMPQIADDVDLIEKEWVDKAKEIVAQTAHDPYLQNKEMNKVKSEYLKKRYNKDIKQSD